MLPAALVPPLKPGELADFEACNTQVFGDPTAPARGDGAPFRPRAHSMNARDLEALLARSTTARRSSLGEQRRGVDAVLLYSTAKPFTDDKDDAVRYFLTQQQKDRQGGAGG